MLLLFKIVFTAPDKATIANLYEEKGWRGQRIAKELSINTKTMLYMVEKI